jgi:hypothetical protein
MNNAVTDAVVGGTPSGVGHPVINFWLNIFKVVRTGWNSLGKDHE